MAKTKELPHLDWIMAAKDGDENSLQKIIDQYSGVCVAAYQDIVKQKFSPHSSIVPAIECDTLADKEAIIYEAVIDYDPTRNTKFSSYLYDQMRYRCYKGLNEINKTPTLSDFDKIQFLKEAEGLEREYLKEEAARDSEDLKKILDFLKGVTNKTFKGADKAKKVIELRYFSGTKKPIPYKDIAKKFKVNTQTVLNWHNKLIRYAQTKIPREV